MMMRADRRKRGSYGGGDTREGEVLPTNPHMFPVVLSGPSQKWNYTVGPHFPTKRLLGRGGEKAEDGADKGRMTNRW